MVPGNNGLASVVQLDAAADYLLFIAAGMAFMAVLLLQLLRRHLPPFGWAFVASHFGLALGAAPLVFVFATESADVPGWACELLPLLLQFCVLALFAWITNACFSTYRASCKLLTVRELKFELWREPHRPFLLVGWAVPLAVTVATYVVDQIAKDNLVGENEHGACWIEGYLVGVFVVAPVAACVLGSLLCLAATARNNRELHARSIHTALSGLSRIKLAVLALFTLVLLGTWVGTSTAYVFQTTGACFAHAHDHDLQAVFSHTRIPNLLALHARPPSSSPLRWSARPAATATWRCSSLASRCSPAWPFSYTAWSSAAVSAEHSSISINISISTLDLLIPIVSSTSPPQTPAAHGQCCSEPSRRTTPPTTNALLLTRLSCQCPTAA